MDSLEKFKQANITQDVIAEINNLTNEQLEQLSNEKVTLLIRDKKNKTTIKIKKNQKDKKSPTEIL